MGVVRVEVLDRPRVKPDREPSFVAVVLEDSVSKEVAAQETDESKRSRHARCWLNSETSSVRIHLLDASNLAIEPNLDSHPIRIGNANLGRFTIDRLMTVLARLGQTDYRVGAKMRQLIREIL